MSKSRRPMTAAFQEESEMINDLTCIFSEKGILDKMSGLTVNKRGALCVFPDTGRELLGLYADLTSRLGVELTGFRPPLTSAREADALRLSLDSSVETGGCQLRLAGGGVELAASSIEDLRRGTEYMTVLYPLDGKGGTLEDLDGIEALSAVTIDTETLTVREAAGKGCAAACGKDGGPSYDNQVYGNRASFNRAERHYRQNRDMRVVIDGDTKAEAEAVLAAALRVAMENYETVYPYCVEKLPDGCGGICFRADDEASVSRKGKDIIFSGKGKALEEQVYAYASCERDPVSYTHLTLPTILRV